MESELHRKDHPRKESASALRADACHVRCNMLETIEGIGVCLPKLFF
jgi:hypothetical protein